MTKKYGSLFDFPLKILTQDTQTWKQYALHVGRVAQVHHLWSSPCHDSVWCLFFGTESDGTAGKNQNFPASQQDFPRKIFSCRRTSGWEGIYPPQDLKILTKWMWNWRHLVHIFPLFRPKKIIFKKNKQKKQKQKFFEFFFFFFAPDFPRGTRISRQWASHLAGFFQLWWNYTCMSQQCKQKNMTWAF